MTWRSILDPAGQSLPLDDGPDQFGDVPTPRDVLLERLAPPFRARPYQRELIRHFELMTNECAMLCLPTGAGKTAVAVEVVLARTSHRALWIAPQRETLAQAMRAALRSWYAGVGPPRLRLLALSGTADVARALDGADPTIIFTTAQLLTRIHRRLPPMEVCVFDEAHHAAAEVFGDAWRSVTGRGRGLALGLSATPTRTSATEQPLLLDAFAHTLVLPQGWEGFFDLLVDEQILARPELVDLDVPAHARSRGREDPRRATRLAFQTDRVQSVIDSVSDLARDGERCVVFAADREHGRALTREWRRRGVAAEYVDGETPDANREAALRRFGGGTTSVIVNVRLLVEGVDVPAATAVVLTHPIADRLKLQQMLGRVLRGPKSGGGASCKVVTADMDEAALRAVWSYSRSQYAGWRRVVVPWSSTPVSGQG